MRSGSCVMLAGMLIAVAAASISPLIQSKSDNPCAGCHGNYYQYLDFLEGDSATVLPAALCDTQVLDVTVVLRNDCNAASHNVITSISASLTSASGHFVASSNPLSVGSLGPGQAKSVTWQVSALSAGQDAMIITAQGRNTHENCQLSDRYSPDPVIMVGKSAPNMPPSITLLHPVPGTVATGATDMTVEWNVTDEEKPACQVGLYWSTDGFSTTNNTLATGLPPGQPYTWVLPEIDSANVRLKASVVDPKGLYSEGLMAGPFSIDSTAPAIASVEPPDGAGNVTSSAFIVGRFSEPVSEASALGSFSFQPDPGGVSMSWNANGSVLTVSHAQLSAGTMYNCTFAPGIRDRSLPGNTLDRAYSWSFTTSTAVVPIPSISLSAPSDGSMFYWDRPIEVLWTASGGTGALKVNISLSGNGAAGPFSTAASGLENNGSFSFPAPRLESRACLVEASVYDANRMETRGSSGVFSIARPLAIEASFGLGNGSARPNDTLRMQWNATGGFGAVSVSLFFQPDPDSPLRLAATGLPRSGSYSWTVVDVNTTTARLILNASDEWGTVLGNASDSFAIMSDTGPPPPPPPPKTNHPPLVMFEIKEERVLVNGHATFDASASSDPDGDSMFFTWDFGDGSPQMNTTTPVVVHVYAEAGDFYFQLSVGDGRSRTVQAMIIVVVDARPAVGGSDSDWAAISVGMLVVIFGAVGTAYSAARPGGSVPPGETSFTEVPVDLPPVSFDDGKCVRCGACARRCPRKAIRMKDGRPMLDADACDGCDLCAQKCAKGAIASNGKANGKEG